MDYIENKYIDYTQTTSYTSTNHGLYREQLHKPYHIALYNLPLIHQILYNGGDCRYQLAYIMYRIHSIYAIQK